MSRLNTTFFTGLVTLVPVAATLYFLYWLAITTESLLGRLVRMVLPEQYYLPGTGVAVSLLLVFAVGVLMKSWLVRTVFGWWENLLYRIPLIKSVYGSIRDLLSFISQSPDTGMQQVVTVSMDSGLRVIGFVTRDSLADLSEQVEKRDDIVVYIPLGYMIGGHTVLVARSRIQPLNLSKEDAMRFVLTGGLAKPGNNSMDG